MTALFPDLPRQLRSASREIVVVGFAGGGGSDEGFKMALGQDPEEALNHDAEAIAMHKANFPNTRHWCQNIWQANPADVADGRPIGAAWFSPDCKHFSKAKGGKPRNRNIRDLAWVVIGYAKLPKPIRPRIIFLENVEEFQTWGPLLEDGQPDPNRKGETFRKWVGELKRLGYHVEWRELRACDYGAPTIRKRLFLIARCDGQPIVWPAPTHGKPGSGLPPYRTAAEIIDWSIPCPSIFERSRPLAEATMRRIAAGLRRFVLEAAHPFIVTCNHSGHGFRGQRLDEPFRTITSAHDAHGLVVPYLAGCGGRAGQSAPRGADQTMATMTAKADQILVAAHIQRQFGASVGHAADEPTATVTAGGSGKSAFVAAFLAQHNNDRKRGGRDYPKAGRPVDAAISTITASGSQQAVVTSNLIKLRGTEPSHIDKSASSVDDPVPTISAGGMHIGEVRAFLVKYFKSAEHGQPVDEPFHTLTAKPRFGLVTVEGQDYQVVDIGMRMLTPRELFRAQGFPDDYVIDLECNGRPLSKAAQVRMCGNSVCPPIAAALVRANYVPAGVASEAAE
ncbi:MAG: DNA cytosine methyltransferase [Clostridiaceae bacterium]|nr:DNA cytosine methyltransferase [Clostridiaceae bacterium]